MSSPSAEHSFSDWFFASNTTLIMAQIWFGQKSWFFLKSKHQVCTFFKSKYQVCTFFLVRRISIRHKNISHLIRQDVICGVQIDATLQFVLKWGISPKNCIHNVKIIVLNEWPPLYAWLDHITRHQFEPLVGILLIS